MIDDEKKKEEIKERYRSFKAFSKISSIIYNLISTILIGVVVGLIIENKTGNDKWMVASIVFFSICGIISFYVKVVKFKWNVNIKWNKGFMEE